jgi:diguanylate cyclase (GGDEF)-like protein
MNLDTTTLIVAGCFVVTLSGLLLAGARTQIPAATSLTWWAAADFVYAFGIAISSFPVAIAGFSSQKIGLALICLSPILVWVGFRRFNRKTEPIAAVAIGSTVFLAFVLAIVELNLTDGTLASLVVSTVFFAACAIELWLGRSEPLPARWPLVVLFLISAGFHAASVVDIAAGNFMEGAAPAPGTWFGLIYFEGLLYVVGTAVFMVLLVKERGERQIVLASRKDSLTGIANRGALIESGERLLRRCQQEGTSFSLVMFDLDRFKRINDTYGHAAGDAVLRSFVETTQSILRPTDLFGRYGGEEFVVVLPRATIEAAYVIADRIRNAFMTSSTAVAGAEVKCTVSGGVADAGSSANSLEEIIRIADNCLYRAKELGRNRIERPAKTGASQTSDNVIRVA